MAFASLLASWATGKDLGVSEARSHSPLLLLDSGVHTGLSASDRRSPSTDVPAV